MRIASMSENNEGAASQFLTRFPGPNLGLIGLDQPDLRDLGGEVQATVLLKDLQDLPVLLPRKWIQRVLGLSDRASRQDHHGHESEYAEHWTSSGMM